jgi:hypothetical protein
MYDPKISSTTPKTYRELNWAGVEYKSLHEGEQAVLDHVRHRPT